jgi:hypothetical protein
MFRPLRVPLFAALAVLSGCQCGTTRLIHPVDLDAGVPPDSDYQGSCDVGTVTGKVCSPDQQSWVNGAQVYVSGADCHGDPFLVSVASGADGSFSLDAVPVGAQTVHAELGAFSQEMQVTVAARATTTIPDNQLCVAQKTATFAVITGPGDHIETLLTGLGLTFDTFSGDPASWTSANGGGTLLGNLEALKKYTIVFIDCAAAKKSGSIIDLGPNAAQIASNLQAYVANGGSLYSSDWAMLFPVVGFPGKLNFAHTGTTAIASPFKAQTLVGYAPQTVNATVTDSALAAFVGKSTLQIAYPAQTGAISRNWGLISSVGAGVDVLITAPSAEECSTTDTTCSTAGKTVTQVPLATRFKLTPGRQRGGVVIYTSFNNIAQPTDDVSKVLRYLVLNL